MDLDEEVTSELVDYKNKYQEKCDEISKCKKELRDSEEEMVKLEKELEESRCKLRLMEKSSAILKDSQNKNLQDQKRIEQILKLNAETRELRLKILRFWVNVLTKIKTRINSEDVKNLGEAKYKEDYEFIRMREIERLIGGIYNKLCDN